MEGFPGDPNAAGPGTALGEKKLPSTLRSLARNNNLVTINRQEKSVCFISSSHNQAYFGDITGSFPQHSNKASFAIKPAVIFLLVAGLAFNL